MIGNLRLYFLGIIFLFTTALAQAQYVAIPDDLFRDYLETTFPSCMNGGMLDTTCTDVVTATVVNIYYKEFITDLTGIQYFDALTDLDISVNSIPELPPLPQTLLRFKCINSGLITLPKLPSSLVYLDCSGNKLTSIPTLPATLQILYCGNYTNQFTTLPELPASLIDLNIDNGHLIRLPELPPNLTSLNCGFNQLTSLPALPASLDTLFCHHNPLKCLPILPNDLEFLNCVNAEVQCLPNIPTYPGFNSQYGNLPLCNESTNINECVYTTISGKVFIDENSNGIQDLGEEGYAYAKLELQPGNYIVTTNDEGIYSSILPYGSYTITPFVSAYPHFHFSPSTRNVTLSQPGETSIGNNFAMQPEGIINDLRVILTPMGNLNRGRSTQYMISYSNLGTTTINDIIAALNFPGELTLDNTNPVFSSQADQELSWNIGSLKPGQAGMITVQFYVPVPVLVGSVFSFKATIHPLEDDAVPEDNISELLHTVTGSFDPNFKEVSPEGNISPAQVTAQEQFTYTVHFQNTGNDVAFEVIIRDTISTNFEILEIETIAASHEYTFNMKSGAAVWTFADIMLLDSTANEPQSHGFVKYRIIPKQTLQLGDEIKNTAHIFFDFNEPVVTNSTNNRVSIPLSVINASVNQLEVYPNPSKGVFMLTTPTKSKGSLRITTAEGQVIQIIDHIDWSQEIIIDLNEQPRGLYIIQAILQEGVVTKKVILN